MRQKFALSKVNTENCRNCFLLEKRVQVKMLKESIIQYECKVSKTSRNNCRYKGDQVVLRTWKLSQKSTADYRCQTKIFKKKIK